MSRTSRKKENPPELQELPDKNGNPPETRPREAKKRMPLLFRLTRRTVLFLFLFLLTSVLFFATGNYQDFLDENLDIIVTAVTVTSVFLSVFSAAGIVEAVYFLLKKETGHSAYFLVQIAAMSLSLVFSIAAMVSFSIIGIVSKGFQS